MSRHADAEPPLTPAQPETIQERGFGPFVTFIVRKRPDGVIAHWESRAHRKHLHPAARRGSTWWAPHDRDWWIGVLFAVQRGRP